MISIATVTIALESLLKKDPDLKTFEITRNEYINEDPGRDKWIGIYKKKVEHNAAYLMGGVSASYKTNFSLSVVVQAFEGLYNVPDTDEVLEGRIKVVTDRILDGSNISGTVLSVNGIDVDYQYVYSDNISVPFQIAELTLRMENKG